MADDYVFERLLRRSRRRMIHDAAIAHFLEDSLDTIVDQEDQETARRVLGIPEFVQRLLGWLSGDGGVDVRFLAACLLFVLAPAAEEYDRCLPSIEAKEESRSDASCSVLLLLAGTLRFSESLQVVARSITRLALYVATFEGESRLTEHVVQTLSYIFTDFPRMKDSSIPAALVVYMPRDPEAAIRRTTEAEKARVLRMVLGAWKVDSRVQ